MRGMTLLQLIELLQKKANSKGFSHTDEVEYIICRKSDGAILSISVEALAKQFVKALKLFKGAS